jgi:hypothetical protein
MPTVTQWHSAKPETKVYHNHTGCTEGNNIEAYNVREGTGSKRLCEHCQRLTQEDSFKFLLNKGGLIGGFNSSIFGPKKAQ